LRKNTTGARDDSESTDVELVRWYWWCGWSVRWVAEDEEWRRGVCDVCGRPTCNRPVLNIAPFYQRRPTANRATLPRVLTQVSFYHTRVLQGGIKHCPRSVRLSRSVCRIKPSNCRTESLLEFDVGCYRLWHDV